MQIVNCVKGIEILKQDFCKCLTNVSPGSEVLSGLILYYAAGALSDGFSDDDNHIVRHARAIQPCLYCQT